MNIKRRSLIYISGLLFAASIISGCAGPNLYSINMYYDAMKTSIPQYIKADKDSVTIISVAEFTDSRMMDDKQVIGRVEERDGVKTLVFPKQVRATMAISNGIKEYLRKAGYKVPAKIEQWDLKEQTIPQGVANILIGGNIDELEISCRKGFPTNTYTATMKLTIVFADMSKGIILYKSRVESSYSMEHAWFSENILEEQANKILANAIEKLFEEKAVVQKFKEVIVQ
jgi:hypothetical protein